MPNLMIQPAPVPSWGLAQQRAAQTRGMQNQNLLAEQRLQDYPEERAWTRERRQMDRDEYEYTKHLRDFQTSMEPLVKIEAIDKMLRIVSNKTTLANHDAVSANVHKQLGISPEQGQAGQNAAQIAQEATAAGQDPETYYQTVYKPKQLMTWEQKFELMKEQVKANQPKSPIVGSAAWEEAERKKAEIKGEFTKPTYEQKTLYGPQGQTRNVPVQKGTEYTPPKGWSLAKPEKLQKEPTPQQALMRISGIRKTMATLDKTNEITAMIIAANPELAGMIGQKIDDDLKQQLMDAWNDELDYLYRFAPKSTKKPKRELNVETARKILQEAGGDKGKAREIAKSRGYTF